MEEKEKATGDGHPTTDTAQLNNEQQINNENADPYATMEACQRETHNEKQETDNSNTHNSELTTQNMEVHHHTHHNQGKKKWNEYFWEFLMLFLAVFCGFMAENIREHIVENDRAKEFSKSLVQDLENDTAAINVEKRSAALYISIADSLLALSKTQLEGRNAAKFSFYTRFTYWTVPVSWNRATFEQVKNSGGLRYFKNQELLKKMLEYDGLVNEINRESNANSERGYVVLPLIDAIIEPAFHYEVSKHFLATLDTMSNQTKEIFFSYKLGSLENKREKINELLNAVVVQQRNLRMQINVRWQRAETLAAELIADIKKEYDIE